MPDIFDQVASEVNASPPPTMAGGDMFDQVAREMRQQPKQPRPGPQILEDEPAAKPPIVTIPGHATQQGVLASQVEPETTMRQDLTKFLLSPPDAVQDALKELNGIMVGPFQVHQKAILEPAASLLSPAGLGLAAVSGGVGALAASNTARVAAAGKAADAALSGWFAAGSAQNLIEANHNAKILARQGDYWGALGELGSAGTSAFLGALAAGHAAGQIQDVAAIAAAKRALQERLNVQEGQRRSAERAEAYAEHGHLKQIPGPEEAGPAPETAPITPDSFMQAQTPSSGTVYEGEAGKYTVSKVENGRVTFKAETPSGSFTGTLPESGFTKMVAKNGAVVQQQPQQNAQVKPTPLRGSAPDAGVESVSSSAPQQPAAAPVQAEAHDIWQRFYDLTYRQLAREHPDWGVGRLQRQAFADAGPEPAKAAETPQNSPETPPPLPAESAPVVAGQKQLVPADSIATGEERIGGPHDIQLLPQGRAQAQALAAIPGSFDRVLSSNSDRSHDTVAPAAGKAGVPVEEHADLDTIRHGEMEGLTASESKDTASYYYTHPDERPPGVSKFTGLPGETFHEFLDREIPVFQKALDYQRENPDHAQLIAVSSTNMRALRAVVEKNGSLDDPRAYNPQVMLEPRQDPGTMYRLSESKDGKVSMEQVDPSKLKKIPPGILITSHGYTGWNNQPKQASGEPTPLRVGQGHPSSPSLSADKAERSIANGPGPDAGEGVAPAAAQVSGGAKAGPIPSGTWMNEWDIAEAVERYKDHPVLSKATQFLGDLRDETNAHSDGWPYWKLPSHAAAQLMGMIQHPEYASEDNFKRALAPIKAFYTKRGNAAGMKFPEVATETKPAQGEAVASESTQPTPAHERSEEAASKPEAEVLTPDTFMEKESRKIPFTLGGGGYILENKELDRIQAFFKSKPPAGVREQLKKAGFHWAPSVGAWQRQLTANARAATARLFNVNMNVGVQQPEAPSRVPMLSLAAQAEQYAKGIVDFKQRAYADAYRRYLMGQRNDPDDVAAGWGISRATEEGIQAKLRGILQLQPGTLAPKLPPGVPNAIREKGSNRFVDTRMDNAPVVAVLSATGNPPTILLEPPYDQLTGADRHTLLGAIEWQIRNPEQAARYDPAKRTAPKPKDAAIIPTRAGVIAVPIHELTPDTFMANEPTPAKDLAAAAGISAEDIIRQATEQLGKRFGKGGAEPKAPTRPKIPSKPDAGLKRIREFYTPGNIIHVDYWNKYDKVLQFEENKGSYRVKVQDVDKVGTPTPGEQPRWHSTDPDKRDVIVSKAPVEEAAPVTTAEPRAAMEIRHALLEVEADLNEARRLAETPEDELEPYAEIRYQRLEAIANKYGYGFHFDLKRAFPDVAEEDRPDLTKAEIQDESRNQYFESYQPDLPKKLPQAIADWRHWLLENLAQAEPNGLLVKQPETKNEAPTFLPAPKKATPPKGAKTPKANPLSGAADDARARLRDKYAGPRPTTRQFLSEEKGTSQIDPQDLVDLATIGAEHIVDGATKFKTWIDKVMQDVGGMIRSIAEQRGQSEEDCCREVYALSAKVAANFGAKAEPAPPKPPVSKTTKIANDVLHGTTEEIHQKYPEWESELAAPNVSDQRKREVRQEMLAVLQTVQTELKRFPSADEKIKQRLKAHVETVQASLNRHPEPSKAPLESKLIPEAEDLIASFRQIIHSGSYAINDNISLMKHVKEITGRSVADGSIDTKQIYDILETALNQEIAEFGSGMMMPDASVHDALGNLRALLDRLPTQSIRSDEQIKYQQFSTPPTEALVVARLAAPTEQDLVMEPSAGTGGLAAFARAAGARVLTNEINPRRAELLRISGYAPLSVDAEQIDNVYDDTWGTKNPQGPSVVMMNPPFSAAGERGTANTNDVGYRHVMQALRRLQPGGRLVAILGGGREGFPNEGAKPGAPGARQFWQDIQKIATIRANVGISGKEYSKYGTTFGTRIVVIDKVPFGTGSRSVIGDFDTLEQAWDAVKNIAQDRQPLAEMGAGGPGTGVGPRGPAVGGVREPGRQPGTVVRGGPGGGQYPVQTGGSQVRPGTAHGNQPDIRPGSAPEGDRTVGSRDPHVLEDEQNKPVAAEAQDQSVVAGEDVGDYVRYTPETLPKEWGAQPHAAIIVETQTMASVPQPPITMRPKIPQSVIDSGNLSDIQLATVAQIIQAHERFLASETDENGKPIGEPRRLGFFNGDGTGVGKGRVNAAAAVHYWNTLPAGKRRFVWISFNEELAEAARDDLDNVGGKSIPIFSLDKVKVGVPLKFSDGVLFVPYSKMAAAQTTKADGTKFEKGATKEEKGKGQKVMRRLQQIMDWAGDEPLIVMDEAHKAKNATVTKEQVGEGKRTATKKPTLTGLAALEVQNRIPKARVLYSSATGFSDVSNMAYANRLGGWGPGTAFKDFQDFRQQVDQGGIGIMELVARDLKAQGKYVSRFISYKGVAFDEIHHEITPEQHAMLDRGGQAWRLVIERFNHAAAETTSNTDDAQAQGQVKAKAMSQLWGAELRFYRSIYTAMKIPTLIKIIDGALDPNQEGGPKSVVISVLETGAAAQDREVERIMHDEDPDFENADLSPMSSLIDMVDKRFPTLEYETIVDPETGEKTTRVKQIQDENGVWHDMQNAEALRAKAELMTQLEQLRNEFPDSALDQIINKYGIKNVAEMTKRAERLVRNPQTGKRELNSRGSDLTKTNLHEMAAFQNGDKHIAIISNAASTGISLHSSVRALNQEQRVHILLQLKWSADMTMQDLGRTHRTAQRLPPHYMLLSLNVEGEKRFAATIARRLEQLGALSRGERKAGQGGTDFSKYNFESRYGKMAVQDVIDALYFNGAGISAEAMQKYPALTDGKKVLEMMGLYDPNKEEQSEDSPTVPVNRFFNRMMILPVDMQNELFRLFDETMTAKIETAKRLGMFDAGAEKIRATHLEPHGSPLVVYQDPTTGAQAVFYKLMAKNPRDRLTWERTKELIDSGRKVLLRVKATGRLLSTDTEGMRQVDPDTGHMREGRYARSAAGQTNHLYLDDVGPQENQRFEAVPTNEDMQAEWQKQYDAAGPWLTTQHNLITGSVLPIWGKIQEKEGAGPTARSKPIKVKIGTLDNGKRLIGAEIEPHRAAQVLKALGHEPVMEPEDVMRKVSGGKKFDLMQGAVLKRSKVSGENRIEVEGAQHFQRLFPSWGLYSETIASKPRWFIPTGDAGIGVLKRVLKELPVRGEDEGEPGFLASEFGEESIIPRLADLKDYVQKRFQEDGPKANYSGLGALQDRYVRNLSQLEKVSAQAHTAAIRAASSRAQAATILRSAVPAITKELEGSDVGWPELRLALIESRLRGLRKRWQTFSDQARDMTDEELAKAYDEHFAGLLEAIQGKKNLPQDIAQTAAALVEQGAYDDLRGFLGDTFTDAAARVSRVMEPEWFDAVTQDPKAQKALDIYKKLVEKPMAENHALNEGVFSDALGPLNTYYPLISSERPITSGPGRLLPYHKPRNMANAFATGLSAGYDATMEALKDRLASAVRSNDKAALLKTLEQQGLLKPLKHNQRAEEEVFTWAGNEYQAERVEISPARIILQNGKMTNAPASVGLMPKWLARELRPVLERQKYDTPTVIDRVLSALNTFALAGPADFVFHSSNLLGTLVANTPFLADSIAGKLQSAPFVKKFASIVKVATTDPTTPEAAAELIEMAKLGLIPDRYGSVTFSQKAAEELGAEKKRFSFSPLLFGPKGLDVRARLVMYRLAKQINPDATPQQLFHFVNQLGNYVPALQGEMERALKASGFSPFYTAGSTMIRNGINAWTGRGPMPKDGIRLRLWQMLTGGALGTLALWIITYQAMTGKLPWEDRRAKLLAIPAPDELRHSALGRALWGTGPEVGYINFGFFSPLIMRGARATGVAGAFEARQLHGNAGQVMEAAQRDILNAFSHPALGPTARAAFVGVTGAEPYLTSFRDRSGKISPQFFPAIPPKTRPGLPALGARAAAAAKELNAFYGNLGVATGMAGDDKGMKGNHWLRMVTDLTMPGLVSNATNPYKKAEALRAQRAGAR